MLLKSIVSVLAVAGIAAAQAPAPTYTKGEAHIDMKGIDAKFTFTKVDTGVKVDITVLKGLNTTVQVLPTGFQYHIHVLPVGAGGNCTATGAHLDPTKVGPNKCVPAEQLATCEVGDLAGKHGNFIATADGALAPISYIDTALSFTGDGAITGRSVVIHNNVTRIACADLIVEGYTAPVPAPSGTGTAPPEKTNGAAKLVGSVALTGLVAMMMLAL